MIHCAVCNKELPIEEVFLLKKDDLVATCKDHGAYRQLKLGSFRASFFTGDAKETLREILSKEYREKFEFMIYNI